MATTSHWEFSVSPLSRPTNGATAMRARTVLALALTCLVMGARPLLSLESGSSLQIHGFVSQGALITTKHNYIVSSSTQGSFELSEVALTASAVPWDRLRIGMQLFARDLGDEGNYAVSIDWAYGDFRLRDWLGVRAGRFKTPVQLYNQVRDIDAIRIPIFLPQAVYAEDIRENSLATDGVDLYGNIPLGYLGDVDYDAFVGTVNIQNANSRFQQERNTQAGEAGAAAMEQGMAAFFPPGAVNVSYEGTDNQKAHFRYAGGGMLRWNTPLRGLMVGGSAVVRRLEESKTHRLVSAITLPQNPAPMKDALAIEGSADVSMLSYTGFAELQIGDFLLAAEADFLDMSMDVLVVPPAPQPAMNSTMNARTIGVYGLAGYRITSWMAVSAYYGSFRDLDDFDGSKAAAADPSMATKDYFSWHNDACASLRFDVTPYWLIKVEGHAFQGTARVLSIDNVGRSRTKDWGLIAGKTTFTF